jgi:uncharacterized membrane protein
MIEAIVEVWNVATEMVGFSPALMVPVFVLVSLLAWALKVREKYPDWKNFILGVMCVVIGCIVALVGEWETYRELIADGLVLGSVSALAYQILKGLFRGAKRFIEDKLEVASGINIDIEDNDVL